MIDDYAKAQELVARMKAGLPIPIRATADLARASKQFPTTIVVGQELAIKSVFYMGDELTGFQFHDAHKPVLAKRGDLGIE